MGTSSEIAAERINGLLNLRSFHDVLTEFSPTGQGKHAKQHRYYDVESFLAYLRNQGIHSFHVRHEHVIAQKVRRYIDALPYAYKDADHIKRVIKSLSTSGEFLSESISFPRYVFQPAFDANEKRRKFHPTHPKGKRRAICSPFSRQAI